MSTLTESYKQAYAAKNAALADNLNAKVKTLEGAQKRLRLSAENDMRLAYAEYVRSAAASAQQSRLAGQSGGAAKNTLAGLGAAHRMDQAERQRSLREEIADIDEDIATATASAQKQIADNNTALAQKVTAQQLKELQAQQKAEAAAKAAAEKAAAAAEKAALSAANTAKTKVLSMMKMGLYDASFAGILGISDGEVRSYVNRVLSKSSSSKSSSSTSSKDEQQEQEQESTGTRAWWTYKQPLR